MAKGSATDAVSVFISLIIVMGAFGVLFTIFPLGNPLSNVGGTWGAGLFYASVISLGLMIIFLLIFALKKIIKDLLYALGKELNVDIDEIFSEYSNIARDEWKALLGKKRKASEHEVQDDE